MAGLPDTLPELRGTGPRPGPLASAVAGWRNGGLRRESHAALLPGTAPPLRALLWCIAPDDPRCAAASPLQVGGPCPSDPGASEPGRMRVAVGPEGAGAPRWSGLQQPQPGHPRRVERPPR